MLIVTGALGFIGSCLISHLNKSDHRLITAVDDFYKDYKDDNLKGKQIREWIHRDLFLDWFKKSEYNFEGVFHLGARTDTTEKDSKIFDALNLAYSKEIWKICVEKSIPLVYASSAATYGIGENGFSDTENNISDLEPLNPYGQSKHDFDIWALSQKTAPPFWAGLKFFNVYGPNEYHKGRMASVIFHCFNQIKKTGKMKLFRSHRDDFADGQQKRDFIYVKDVVNVCSWMLNNKPNSGIYNLGTGEASTFYDLATNTFKGLELEPIIEFIDIPADIRETYQYYTKAEMAKLYEVGYTKEMFSLEKGVEDYVKNHLIPNKYM